jgi:hypothetical protein
MAWPKGVPRKPKVKADKPVKDNLECKSVQKRLDVQQESADNTVTDVKKEAVTDYLTDKAKKGLRSLYIPELLEVVANAPEEERIQILKNNDGPALKELFRLTYTDIEFLLTPEEVEAVKFEDIDIPAYSAAPCSLYSEHRRFNIFTPERGSNLRKSKLEILLSQMLSSLYAPERDVFVGLFSKKPLNGVTKEMAQEVYPDLF